MSRHWEQVNGDPSAAEQVKQESRQSGRYKKICITDPDASMATNARNRRLAPAYKQHAVVDDWRGATVTEALGQRLTQAEKDTIKNGGIPTEWKPARRSQIDRDGR